MPFGYRAPMRHRLTLLLAGLSLAVSPAVALAADPSPSPMDWGASCRVPASPAPMATADCGPGTAPVAVIDVSGEVYRIELTTPAALEGARALLAGTSAAAIPNGIVVYGDQGRNAPWSWHIDPATLEWAEMATEVCDGRPTQLQDGVFTFERFCPWSAQVLAIVGDPAAPAPQPIGDVTALPLTVSGATPSEDRTLAQRVVLEGGSYRFTTTLGDPIDPARPDCGTRVSLMSTDQISGGSIAMVPGEPSDPTRPVELGLSRLPAGAYDLFITAECAWSTTVERTGP